MAVCGTQWLARRRSRSSRRSCSPPANGGSRWSADEGLFATAQAPSSRRWRTVVARVPDGRDDRQRRRVDRLLGAVLPRGGRDRRLGPRRHHPPAVCADTSGGITLGLVANARRMGTLALEGGLDPVLALPVPPLATCSCGGWSPPTWATSCSASRSSRSLVTPRRAARLFVAVTLSSATLLTGFLVLTGSLAFFAGRSESGELGFHAMLLLGAYPVDIFAGTAKLVMYTVVPAAFVSTIPAPASSRTSTAAGGRPGLASPPVRVAAGACSRRACAATRRERSGRVRRSSRRRSAYGHAGEPHRRAARGRPRRARPRRTGGPGRRGGRGSPRRRPPTGRRPRAEGELPGAVVIERIHLEWRLDPTSDHRIPEASADRRVILVCNEGYSSSLAAVTLRQLGVPRATDLIGGYRAWRALT